MIRVVFGRSRHRLQTYCGNGNGSCFVGKNRGVIVNK